MSTLTHLIDAQLVELPPNLALQWPGGRAGPGGPCVTLKLRDKQLLTHVARGHIGDLAERTCAAISTSKARLPT